VVAPAPQLFDRIVLVYNPANPRIPLTLAASVRDDLRRQLPDLPVTFQPTRYPGHARELAHAAAGSGRPLIIAVSGDGVYSEVVNGIMDVDGSRAVSAVAAAGNANDHRRSTRRMPLVAAILDGRARHLDLLRLTVRTRGAWWSRYAHSYVGLGLTPLMAIGLNNDMKGTAMELISVMRTFNRLEPVEISTAAGERALFDSLVFANVARMAKYGRVSNSGRPDDGLFEVVSCPHRGRWRIALMVLRAATVGLGKQPRISHCEFVTTKATPLQIDGEVIHLDANSQVIIDCVFHALTTVG
jgi:diacylglycerol kinase family enzyme